MNEQERFEQRVIEGSAKYLQLQGMEILDKAYQCPFGWADVVARDEDGVIRFAICRARHWSLPRPFAISDETRERFERIAISWLDGHRDMADAMLSFDVIDVGVFGEDGSRAIIRHHRNVLETPDAAYQPDAGDTEE